MSSFPTLQPEPEPQPTPQAESEAALFASRDLKRGDTVRTHLHRGGLLVFWVCLSIALLLVLVWAWQIATPDDWHFLSAGDEDKLQTIPDFCIWVFYRDGDRQAMD